MADARVLFGVAGWSYPDWQGIVYPRGCKDTLRAVAQRVDLIEINNTFYRPPQAQHCRSWAERTADLGTRFTAKLPHEFTHERTADAALVAACRAGFAPLLESGRLLGLLAQFDWRFAFAPAAIEHLATLAAAFAADTQLFVELRHRSWNAQPALDALQGLGVSVLELDYPGLASGFSRDVTGVHGRTDTACFRLHGRNQAWFRKGAGRDEVYDWHYGAGEVEQLGRRLQRIAATSTRTLVVANNHFHGKAMQVVEDLLAWYRQQGAAAPS
ncbi:MAG: DUF72 domain-containing protein [Planctomycetes bacterium]|nr:DUF72 domain-containing protein [Planctomycetota bacterium]